MPDGCNRSFDEVLLTGYVDGALTQGSEQRVRIHLEDCQQCRAIVADLHSMRELTMTSSFRVPEDTQWSAMPRGTVSRFSHTLGWTLIVTTMAMLAAIAFVALGVFLLSPAPLLAKLLTVGGAAGAALLLTSVLIDRLKVLKTDRYREVQK